jgi:hypothetical protein
MAVLLFSPNKSQHAHSYYFFRFIFSCCSLVVRFKSGQQANNKRTYGLFGRSAGGGKNIFPARIFIGGFCVFLQR